MKKDLYSILGGVIMSFFLLGVIAKCQTKDSVYEWYIDKDDQIQSREIVSTVEPAKYLFTGQVQFNFAASHGKIWQKNEGFSLTLKNVYGQFNIDNFNEFEVKKWLKSTGIEEKDIIFVKSFGSSDKQAIELFYAYLSTDTVEYRDVCIAGGSLQCGYQKRSGVRFSNFLYIIHKIVKTQ